MRRYRVWAATDDPENLAAAMEAVGAERISRHFDDKALYDVGAESLEQALAMFHSVRGVMSVSAVERIPEPKIESPGYVVCGVLTGEQVDRLRLAACDPVAFELELRSVGLTVEGEDEAVPHG